MNELIHAFELCKRSENASLGPNSSQVLRVSMPSRFEGIVKKLFGLIGEFDPGSERTLAAGLTHASRTRIGLRTIVKWRTGE